MTDDHDGLGEGPRPGDARRVPNPRRNEPVRENPAPPLGSPTTRQPVAHGGPRGRPAPPLGSGAEGPVLDAPRGAPVWLFGLFAIAVVLAAIGGNYLWWRTQQPQAQQQAAAGGAPVAPGLDASAPVEIEAYTPADTLTARTAQVRVRAAPNAAASVLQRLAPGDAVFVTGRVAGVESGWLVVPQADGARGYVAAADLIPLRTWRDARGAGAPAPSVALESRAAGRGRNPAAAEAPKPGEAFVIANPVWISQPSRQDIYRVYPPQAAQRRVQGAAVLECQANAAGALSCVVIQETPLGFGFGNAALQLAPRFRLRPTSGDGRSVAGGRVRVQVPFRA